MESLRKLTINFLLLVAKLLMKKIAHMSVVWAYMNVSLWLCVFVVLYVRMFILGANKVEGTMSWMFRNQWDLGIY